MKLTINEIAEMAQVAKSTVSKALNGQKGVSEEKRSQILALAAAHNYEPGASAQALASNRTGCVGLLIPHEPEYSLSGSYWSAIITSIAQTANDHNYSLMILTPPKGDDLSVPVESVLRRRNVDGLIIGAEQLDPSMTARLVAEEIPFVFIGRNSRVRHWSVDVDNEGGSERLVASLIGSGYRKIACLAGPEDYLYSRERVSGYRTALRNADIAWSAIVHSDYNGPGVRESVARLFRDHGDMDALFITAGGDLLLDCIDVLRLSGLNLRKFGLGAFDDYRFFDYLDIPVCTIRQPLKELGSAAADILFSFLDGQSPEVMDRILDVELVLR